MNKLKIMPNMILFRNKKVGKHSKNSGAIYLPKRLIGEKFKVILIPEDIDGLELRRRIKERIEKNLSLKKEIKRLRNRLGLR